MAEAQISVKSFRALPNDLSASSLGGKRIDQNGNQWTVTDIGSTNGTFVNGEPLQPTVTKVIAIGDTIRFSTLEFKVDP